MKKKRNMPLGRPDTPTSATILLSRSRDVLGATSGSLFTVALAKLLCPVCWPAYAGVISSLGLASMLHAAWLAPVAVIAMLALVLGLLGFRAETRRGYAPLRLGLLGAGMLLVGEFVLNMMPLMYAGGGLLVAASVWNGWPHRREVPGNCSESASSGA